MEKTVDLNAREAGRSEQLGAGYYLDDPPMFGVAPTEENVKILRDWLQRYKLKNRSRVSELSS